MVCLSSSREVFCKAISYCYHLLFAKVYGKFERFGCDLPQNQQEMTLAYTPPNGSYQQICISTRNTKLCYCTTLHCNQQWIVNTMSREFNRSQVLNLMIGVALIIMPWNVLFCYINRSWLKVVPNFSSLLFHRSTLSGVHRWFLFPVILNIVLSMCLLLSSWIPAVVTCKSRSEERHITEMIFLPQIFNNSTLLSLFFIPFGFLPLTSIPCLAFCAITTVSERPSRIQSVKTLMIYCDGIFAIIYYTSAYFMGKYVNSFVESFHLECTVQTRYWTIATIIAYSIGLLCTVTVLLLITTRPTESSKKQKDEPLANEYLARSRESLQQASSASISTAHSASTDSKHNTIELSPEPFIVNSSSGILNLRNVYSNDWAAIRILSNNSELSIHPTKFLLPPGRMSATEVTLKNQLNGELSSRLLVQWYIIGEDCPARNVNALWTRPYCVPRDQWHCKIIPVYFDFG